MNLGKWCTVVMRETGSVPQFSPITTCFISTCSVLSRDKNVIYNTKDRPKAVLIPQKCAGAAGAAGDAVLRRQPVVSPSEEFTRGVVRAANRIYEDQLMTTASRHFDAGKKLERHLRARKIPLEGAALRRRRDQVQKILGTQFESMPQEVLTRASLESEEEPDRAIVDYNKLKSKLENKFLYKWIPIDYDLTCGLSYLLTRAPPEYAALVNIFQEIRRQEPSFRPKTLFDFGSGVGTGYWATNHVFGKLSEVFCVDPSTHMNDIAKSIILEGRDNDPLPAGLSFRLHYPTSTGLKYDLVMSAFSLLELPSAEARISTVHSLWNRVEEGGCLVVAEMGTNAGFQVISECRDYVLQVGNQLEAASCQEADHNLEAGHSLEAPGEEATEDSPVCEVVAPCPHQSQCPRYHTDNVPCNFPVRYRYFDLPLFEKINSQEENFSYVVIKKGVREKDSLPILVEQPIKGNKQLYCRLCTTGGRLQEVIIKKKDDPELYETARRRWCGRELPVRLENSRCTGSDAVVKRKETQSEKAGSDAAAKTDVAQL